MSPTGMTIIHKEEGFTLLELAFVVVLFVMMVSLSAPAFLRTLRSWTRRTSIEDILAVIEFAHERAIFEQRDYGIHFDEEKKAYWLVRRDGEGSGGLSRIPETWGRSRSLPSDANFQMEGPIVLFHPNGTATSFYLEIIPQNGPAITLDVDPVMGKGSFHEQIS